MNLTISRNYKSLNPLTIELPDFVVICGVNGAGKSQLLKGIADGVISLTSEGAYEQLNPILHVSNHSLVPADSSMITYDALNHLENSGWDLYQLLKRQAADQHSDFIKDFINLGMPSPGFDLRFISIIKAIAEHANVPVDQLSGQDFFNYYPLHLEDTQNNLFNRNLTLLFKKYQNKVVENKFHKYLAIHEGQAVQYMDDDQFTKVYGEPPWDFLNRVLTEAKLDYRTNIPPIIKEAPYEFSLLNVHNSASVNFSDLSAGEKVIMSLVVALYNVALNVDFPKVILMDEPDASLHPSMARYFINVVQRVLVEQKGIKVILVTHSPSTVAMVPDDAVFIMRKTAPRIERVNRDTALKILTAGVPSLSINYENRKQIFVESKYDVMIYSGIYEKLKDNLLSEVSLNFISSGVGGSGNCDQVEDIVKRLRDNGNKTVYGIIDWDRKNSGSEYIKVLGLNKRYSIENYIFDPIILAVYLLREKFILKEDFGMKSWEIY